MFKVLDKNKLCTDQLKIAMHKSVKRRNEKTITKYDKCTEDIIENTKNLKIEHELLKCYVKVKIPGRVVYRDDRIEMNVVTKGLLAKECCEKLKERIEKEWKKNAFYNEEINDFQDARVRGNVLRYNAAAKINNKLIELMVEKGKINPNAKWYGFRSQNQAETQEWLHKIQNETSTIKWLAMKYDLAIKEIKILVCDTTRVTDIIFQTKHNDEGFEGGYRNMWYERERLNEEWKVAEMRKNKI